MLVNVTDLVELLKVDRSTLYRWMEKDFPKPIKLNGSIRWKREDIEAWIELKKLQSAGATSNQD